MSEFKGEEERGWLCATPIIWRNVMIMAILHTLTVAVFVEGVRGSIALNTFIFFWFYGFINAFGILAGAHRLWSHRSYKARVPLRVLLMLMQTASLQNNLHDWCRDHRAHHKFSETDADPHNSKRGLFFSHIGWLMCRKHPSVRQLAGRIKMDDLLEDPVIQFQCKYYYLLVVIFWYLVPVSVCMFLLGESLLVATLVNCWRYVISLHNTWLVNSLAHWHGSRPYNRHIEPRQNRWVAYMSLGEGYHNYHHTFPWDYSASESGWRQQYNLATAFIDLFAWFGLAYERKIPSTTLICRRMAKMGDLGADLVLHLNRLQRARLRGPNRPSQLSLTALGDNLIGLIMVSTPVWITALSRLIYLSM